MRFPDTGNEESGGEVELERVLKSFQTATSLQQTTNWAINGSLSLYMCPGSPSTSQHQELVQCVLAMLWSESPFLSGARKITCELRLILISQISCPFTVKHNNSCLQRMHIATEIWRRPSEQASESGGGRERECLNHRKRIRPLKKRGRRHQSCHYVLLYFQSGFFQIYGTPKHSCYARMTVEINYILFWGAYLVGSREL